MLRPGNVRRGKRKRKGGAEREDMVSHVDGAGEGVVEMKDG